MNWPAAAFMISLAGWMFASVFLRHRLSKQFQAGKISGRRAGWLYAAVAGGPYLALFAYIVIRSPGSWWIALLGAFVVYAVQIVPWIAAFRYPEDERRKRPRAELPDDQRPVDDETHEERGEIGEGRNPR